MYKVLPCQHGCDSEEGVTLTVILHSSPGLGWLFASARAPDIKLKHKKGLSFFSPTLNEVFKKRYNEQVIEMRNTGNRIHFWIIER